jgi:predicted dehydrogenase
MRLPEGVSHRPREKQLIAASGSAVIEIATSAYPENQQYELTQPVFRDSIAPYLRGDWEQFDRVFRLRSRRVEGNSVEPPPIYGRAEHRGTPRKPNITVLPNLEIVEHRGLASPISVLGCCTLGHFRNSETLRTHEVYEFQTHGLLVIDREGGEVDAWVAQDGDKVVIPNACHTTLYNLGDDDHPLITLDFGGPNRNRAEKKTAKQLGPFLLGYYDDSAVVFTVNHLHINSPSHKAGVRLPLKPRELQDRQVKIPRVGRLDLGEFMLEKLTQDTDVIARFAKLGIRIRKASPEAALLPDANLRASCLYFSRPLIDATKPGTDVSRYFISDQGDYTPGAADDVGMAAREKLVASEKKRLGNPTLKHPQTEIVVEGAGDWVTEAYRPVLARVAEKAQQQGKKISVFYADDSRWRNAPEWTQKPEAHETYLDKANAGDYAMYRIRKPDIVFIVTPDFTHSSLAQWWVSRKAPLVFVEKPFDSQLRNVEALFNALGRSPLTTVLGLDHYQFRAHKFREILPKIEKHLGGAIAGVEFYMTEVQALELGRIRTLQYGLTLDMLPHMLALITCVGDVSSIDDIQVLDAGQYGPELKAIGKNAKGEEVEEDVSGRFLNETYSKLKFTFEDYSGNRHRVPCTAVVGKGFKRATKYLEMTGKNRNGVRVEFGGKPDLGPANDYPWGRIMLLFDDDSASHRGARQVNDPHCDSRVLRVARNTREVEAYRERYYKDLIEGLTEGNSTTLGSTLSPGEAWEIVRALDRIWWAIQDFREKRGWSEHGFQQTDPIELARRQSTSANGYRAEARSGR